MTEFRQFCAVYTRDKLYSAHCTVQGGHCTVQGGHSTVQGAHCTVQGAYYNMGGGLLNLSISSYSTAIQWNDLVQHILSSVQFTVYSGHYHGQCTVPKV